MKSIAVFFFSVLIIFYTLVLQAAPPPDQKAALYQIGIQSLQEGQFDKTLHVAEKIRQIDPDDEISYRLSVMANWAKKDLSAVVATVQIAKKKGIESPYLYKYQIQALYFLADFAATLQGFRRIEDLFEEQMKKEQSGFE